MKTLIQDNVKKLFRHTQNYQHLEIGGGSGGDEVAEWEELCTRISH